MRLSEAALWYRIEDLKNEARELNTAIADISQLVSYTRVDSMIDFLISKLHNYFIPETLVFMVKPPRKNNLRQYYYSNLRKVDKTLDTKYFYILEDYFDNLAFSPHAVETMKAALLSGCDIVTDTTMAKSGIIGVRPVTAV